LCIYVWAGTYRHNPIVYSYTTDINNYLIFDENIEVVERIFPKEIPNGAKNIDYYYSKKSNIYTEVVARWSLPNDVEYNNEINRIKSIGTYVIYEKGDFRYIGLHNNFLSIDNDYYILSFFAFHIYSHEVRYIYYCGLMNEYTGFQTSYYSKLNWTDLYFPTPWRKEYR